MILRKARLSMTKSNPSKSTQGEVKIGLYDSFMTPYLQAGLAGLAATIQAWVETRVLSPNLTREIIPNGVRLTWEHSDTSATLWAVYTDEGVYLKWDRWEALHDFVSQSISVEDGLLMLKAFESLGGYNREFRIHHQNCLALTFLDNPQSCTGGSRSFLQVRHGDSSVQHIFNGFTVRGVNHSTALKTEMSQWLIAGWAYPGVSGKRSMQLTLPLQAYLPAVFGIVGCPVLGICTPNKAISDHASVLVPPVSNLREAAAYRAELVGVGRNFVVSTSEEAAIALFYKKNLLEYAGQEGQVIIYGKPKYVPSQTRSRCIRLQRAPQPRSRDRRLLQLLQEHLPATLQQQKEAKTAEEPRCSFWAIPAIRAVLARNIGQGKFFAQGVKSHIRDYDSFREIQFSTSGLRRLLRSMREEGFMDNKVFAEIVTIALHTWRGGLHHKYPNDIGRIPKESYLLVKRIQECHDAHQFARLLIRFLADAQQGAIGAASEEVREALAWARSKAGWQDASELMSLTVQGYDPMWAIELKYQYKLYTEEQYNQKLAEIRDRNQEDPISGTQEIAATGT